MSRGTTVPPSPIKTTFCHPVLATWAVCRKGEHGANAPLCPTPALPKGTDDPDQHKQVTQQT